MTLLPNGTRPPTPLSSLVGIVMFLTLEAAAGEDGPRPDAPNDLRIITNSIGMKLSLIPAGNFMMGSPRSEFERDAKENLHEVVITKPFYMGVFEVTQAEFARIIPFDQQNRAVFDRDRGGGPNHPMENVSWEMADEFCKRLSAQPVEQRAGRKYRLPTEAEWEYACRGGTTTSFHFGDSLASLQANFNGNYPYGNADTGPYLRRTAKVGSYKPNAFGLHDIHGNVAEWCADWYDAEYYDNSPDQNPLGPPFGLSSDGFGEFYSVVRGGSWLDDARGCRSAYRYRAMRRMPNRLIGFRVVCEVESDANGQ